MAEQLAPLNDADSGATLASIVHASDTCILRKEAPKASKMLTTWREQGLLVALPGRTKRNMAYTKPSASESPVPLLSPQEDNNGEEG